MHHHLACPRIIAADCDVLGRERHDLALDRGAHRLVGYDRDAVAGLVAGGIAGFGVTCVVGAAACAIAIASAPDIRIFSENGEASKWCRIGWDVMARFKSRTRPGGSENDPRRFVVASSGTHLWRRPREGGDP